MNNYSRAAVCQKDDAKANRNDTPHHTLRMQTATTAAMSVAQRTTPQRTEAKQEEANEQADEAQTQKLKRWTEKPFPFDLREETNTPFLHQFTCVQLRAGLIHAITTRKALEASLNNLLEIQQNQYSNPKHDEVFRGVKEKLQKELGIDYDRDVMIDEETLEAEDHEAAIREWENDCGGFDDERMLRYTVSVVSRTNWKMRGQIREMKVAVGRAQGDV